jgi:Concanavalin A-like lectin/glucanases superfamily
VNDLDATERDVEAWLQDGAQPMPRYVLESSLERVAQSSQVNPRGPFGIPWLNRPVVAVAGVLAALVIAISFGPGMLERSGRSQSGGASPSACLKAPASLTGWWPGDGSVDDIAGGRDAELIGGAAFAPALVDQGFQLDGKDDFVDVANDPALDVGRRDFSVALWVRFDDTAGEQVLLEKWIQGAGMASGWTLTKLETGVLGFFTEDGLGAGNGAASDAIDLPAGSWLHVAARRVGGTVDLFLNGELVATASNPSAILDLDTDASIKFGHRGGPGDTPGSVDDSGYYLDGVVDEVQLTVGQALTDDNVRSSFRAGQAGTCKP